jgi:hypothetical protein
MVKKPKHPSREGARNQPPAHVIETLEASTPKPSKKPRTTREAVDAPSESLSASSRYSACAQDKRGNRAARVVPLPNRC